MTETVSDTAPEHAAPDAGASSGAYSGDWRAALPEDLAREPSLASIRDVAALAKSYVHAQRLVGGERLALPRQGEDLSTWDGWARLGRPERPEDYVIAAPALPDGMAWDREAEAEFRPLAHRLGLLPHQVDGLVGFFAALKGREGAAPDPAPASDAAPAPAPADLEAELRAAWGPAYDAEIARARAAARAFASPAELAAVEGETGSPALVRLFARIGAAMGEDRLVAAGHAGLHGPAGARAAIDRIMGDPAHPYWDRWHPGHKAAVAEMTRLFELKGD